MGFITDFESKIQNFKILKHFKNQYHIHLGQQGNAINHIKARDNYVMN